MALAPNKFRAEFPSQKKLVPQELRGRDTRELSRICFEYPEKSLLKSSHPQKNTFQNILTPKNPEIGNFKPQKILRSPLSLEIRSNLPPPPVGVGYRPRRITPSDRDLYNSSAYSKVSLIIHLESF